MILKFLCFKSSILYVQGYYCKCRLFNNKINYIQKETRGGANGGQAPLTWLRVGMHPLKKACPLLGGGKNSLTRVHIVKKQISLSKKRKKYEKICPLSNFFRVTREIIVLPPHTHLGWMSSCAPDTEVLESWPLLYLNKNLPVKLLPSGDTDSPADHEHNLSLPTSAGPATIYRSPSARPSISATIPLPFATNIR